MKTLTSDWTRLYNVHNYIRELYTDARSFGAATTTYTATDAVDDDVRRGGK